MALEHEGGSSSPPRCLMSLYSVGHSSISSAGTLTHCVNEMCFAVYICKHIGLFTRCHC